MDDVLLRYNEYQPTYLTMRRRQAVAMVTCVPLPEDLVRKVVTYLPEVDPVMDNWRIRECLRLWAVCPERALEIAGPIEQWDTSKVTDMSRLFFVYPSPFPARWLLGNPLFFDLQHVVKNRKNMLQFITSMKALHAAHPEKRILENEMIICIMMKYFFLTFNVDIRGWDTSNVTNMKEMFYGAEDFNQPIGGWNVSNVRTMQGMFKCATSFNQPLEDWDVAQVTDMSSMFHAAKAFNQPLYQWNVSPATNTKKLLFGACRMTYVVPFLQPRIFCKECCHYVCNCK